MAKFTANTDKMHRKIGPNSCLKSEDLLRFMSMTIDQMKQRLQEAYPDANPNSDIIVNDLTGTLDHWEVHITSSSFAGLSRIEQHQHVMSAFGPELKTGEVHALTIKTITK